MKNPYLDDEDNHQENDDDDDDDDDLDWYDGNAELVTEDDDDQDDPDWIPDRDKARQARRNARPPIFTAPSAKTSSTNNNNSNSNNEDPSTGAQRSSTYTQEEEELIAAMGGKQRASKREAGFLGDSTLKEIAMDYSVPVCYLADVLTMWGVPVPIDINDRLGDLVTGEQAFAIVEAVYSLDVAALHDRYSNQSLVSVCEDFDIPLRDAFEMAVKEGWSLPFGVQTFLRVEQEEELIRVLGAV